MCDMYDCALCSILRTSFNVSLAKDSGAFGAGIYTSSASNKSYSYTGGGTGAMLLSKVILGRVYNASAFAEVSRPPPGHESVVFDRQNGTLNETVVYTNNAIRPMYVITF
ncbi:hypothetical protein D9619_012277 [Psilocybe cf. subviscida]|uniref:PARP catalytic domain-containing protein n=1 Tax=Psilocybe cf. subviscida TaxID=2480587 RepID=A0A8H5B7H6_9AGAR|nr:hypothetical protein D9619_012277 [Psilocybe cf. subviscida]